MMAALSLGQKLWQLEQELIVETTTLVPYCYATTYAMVEGRETFSNIDSLVLLFQQKELFGMRGCSPMVMAERGEKKEYHVHI